MTGFMMVLGGAGIMILDKTHHLQSSTRYLLDKCRLHYNLPVVLYCRLELSTYPREVYLFVNEFVVFAFTFIVLRRPFSIVS